MKKEIFFAIALLIIYISESRAVLPGDSVNIAPFGKEIIYKTNNPQNVTNLPINLTKSKLQNFEMPLALLISGDGGWYSFEQSISDKLAELGIPTVGLDSRKYFWNRRSPEETTADITNILNYYSRELGRDRFLLIGYSLGSEIIPFIINRLPEELKTRVTSAIMLSPETTTDFEIHITNMLGMGNRQNTYNVLDEIKKMKTVPSICIFGEGEKSEVPGLLAGTNVKIKIIPGDHHYSFNVSLIVQSMKENKAY